MKRITALIAVGALALSACGPGAGSTAATIDDTTITVGEVNGLIYVESGTISKDQFAQFLNLLVEWAVVSDAAGELGVSASDDEIAGEADRIFTEFADEGQSREEFTQSRGVTEEFLRLMAHQEVLYRKITELFTDEERGFLSDEEVAEQLEDTRLALTEVCASHILLGQLQTLEGEELEEATEEARIEAEEVMDRLEAGDDFAELAMEYSDDSSNAEFGGDLGCNTPARYVEEFRDAVMIAPIGQVHEEAVLSSFGYHIILVESRTVPTDQEVVDAIQANAVSTEIEGWVTAALGAAQVNVVERFGSWDADLLQVVPPPA